jgi:hypothetical protein
MFDSQMSQERSGPALFFKLPERLLSA